MSLKLRIRTELDKSPSGDDFAGVLDTIIKEGVSEEELREILPEIIKQVARTRVAAPLMSPRREKLIPAPLPRSIAYTSAFDSNPVAESAADEAVIVTGTLTGERSVYKDPPAYPYTHTSPPDLHAKTIGVSYPVTRIPVSSKGSLISDGKMGPEHEKLGNLSSAVLKLNVYATPLPEAPVRPAPAKVKETPIYSNAGPELLPQAKPVFQASAKVQAYQSNRLNELYPVGSGKYKKLNEMNREDIRHNIRVLEGRVKGLTGRIKGWNKVLDQMVSYKVHIVKELPDSVKEKI